MTPSINPPSLLGENVSEFTIRDSFVMDGRLLILLYLALLETEPILQQKLMANSFRIRFHVARAPVTRARTINTAFPGILQIIYSLIQCICGLNTKLSAFHKLLLGNGFHCSSFRYSRIKRGESEQEHGYDIFEKPAHQGWVLRKVAHAGPSRPERGCYWDEHELVHAETAQRIAYPDWEWAEIDGKRLVWAEAGKLYAGTLAESGLTAITQLYDFTDMVFEPIEAPD